MSRLKELCKELKISDLENLSADIDFDNPEQYLTELLELAVEHRQTKKVERLVKQAKFPTTKTLDTYEFSPITFPDSINKESLLDLGFVERKENICLMGAIGTGKTHLAISLGIKACAQGKNVKFYRTVDLANELIEKYSTGQARKLIERIGKADLLILDEVGYVPFNKKAAEMLFSVISHSYEKQSILITSNLDFGRWNEIFGDDRLTAALIDRIVHHAHILAFSGNSYRLKEAMLNKNTKM